MTLAKSDKMSAKKRLRLACLIRSCTRLVTRPEF
jgi:hypothetical protein